MNRSIRSFLKYKGCSSVVSTNITFRPRYGYISPVDKPVLSLALTSFHQLSAEFMSFTYMETLGSVCPELSIVIGAIGFRFGIQAVCGLIRLFKYKNKYNLQNRDYTLQRSNKDDRIFVKIIDKVLILDSVRDMQFYGIQKSQINRTINKYYRPGNIIASLTNIYLCLNFLRGAYYITASQQFQQFCASTCYLSHLTVHDLHYVTPIMIILINFAILKKSRHPFLINLNHPGNLLNCFNVAFMTGLIFVPLPGIYHFAYVGLALGHLIIRLCRHFLQDTKRGIKKIIR